MAQQEIDHPRSDASASRVVRDNHVGEIGVGRQIGYRARERELSIGLVYADAERIRHRSVENGARHSAAPVRIVQHREHGIGVDSRAVGRQQKRTAPLLDHPIVHVAEYRTPRRTPDDAPLRERDRREHLCGVT